MLYTFLIFYSSFCFSQIGQVLKVEGEVSKISSNGKTVISAAGQILFPGDIVKTGKASLALVRIGKEVKHKLGPDTEFKLTKPKKGLVELIKGSLFSFVKKDRKKKKRTHYRIKTKAMVAGVRGTEFFISYGRKSSKDDNWLCVNEGTVAVTKNGASKEVLVNQGEGVSITGKGISSPKALPWTKKLNWNMDPKGGDLKNSVNIEDAYKDLLDVDYD